MGSEGAVRQFLASPLLGLVPCRALTIEGYVDSDDGPGAEQVSADKVERILTNVLGVKELAFISFDKESAMDISLFFIPNLRGTRKLSTQPEIPVVAHIFLSSDVTSLRLTAVDIITAQRLSSEDTPSNADTTTIPFSLGALQLADCSSACGL